MSNVPSFACVNHNQNARVTELLVEKISDPFHDITSYNLQDVVYFLFILLRKNTASWL